MTMNIAASDFISDSADAFLTTVREAASVTDVIAAIDETVAAFGIEHASFYDFADPVGHIAGSFPAGWTDHYQAHTYHLIDPVFLSLRARMRALSWSGIAPAFKTATESQRVLDEATEFGAHLGRAEPRPSQSLPARRPVNNGRATAPLDVGGVTSMEMDRAELKRELEKLIGEATSVACRAVAAVRAAGEDDGEMLRYLGDLLLWELGRLHAKASGDNSHD